jgi:hypothetical protein
LRREDRRQQSWEEAAVNTDPAYPRSTVTDCCYRSTAPDPAATQRSSRRGVVTECSVEVRSGLGYVRYGNRDGLCGARAKWEQDGRPVPITGAAESEKSTPSNCSGDGRSRLPFGPSSRKRRVRRECGEHAAASASLPRDKAEYGAARAAAPPGP